jgi:hypothetical protein
MPLIAIALALSIAVATVSLPLHLQPTLLSPYPLPLSSRHPSPLSSPCQRCAIHRCCRRRVAGAPFIAVAIVQSIAVAVAIASFIAIIAVIAVQHRRIAVASPSCLLLPLLPSHCCLRPSPLHCHWAFHCRHCRCVAVTLSIAIHHHCRYVAVITASVAVAIAATTIAHLC